MSVKDITAGASVSATATDATIGRFRPLVIIAESAAGPGYAQARANFEARVRAAKGDAVDIVVQGWRDPDGALWAVNRQVWISSITTRTGGFYLISDAEFTLDNDSGETTKLKVENPDVYLAELDFAAQDAVDIDTLEAAKSLRRGKKAGRASIRQLL